MKKLVLFLFIFITALQATYSQSNLQNQLQQGIDKVYNFEFDSAERVFNRIVDNYPNQPHGYYQLAQLHFWIFLGTRDPGEYIVFLKFADLAQEKIDKILDTEENNYRLLSMAGNLTTFKAMAHATNNSSVDAFWASKKAVNYFEKALEANPKYYDAYLGLGLFDYAMSFVPDFLKWAVKLTGLSSNKPRGLNYIKLAYARGAQSRTEASFHLSKIYTDYLADYDSAYIYIRNIISRYPANSLFHYQYAVTLIKDKKFDTAYEELNKVIRINNTKIPQIIALAYYRRGEILFKRNKFEDAIKQYEKFLESTKELDFTGVAALNIAIANKMLGNESEYSKYLPLAKDGNQDVFEDSYARKKSEELIAKGISDDNLFIIRTKNNLDAGRYKTVRDSLKLLIDDVKNPERRILVLTYFAEAAFNLKLYSEANYAAEQILKSEIKNEKWVLSFANYVMAEVALSHGNKNEAREFLEEALDKNNYDFKDQIQADLENLSRRLNRK